MRIAVITGASGGLGCEMVRQLAEEPQGIQEIWCIARNRQALERLEQEVGLPLRLFFMDLCEMESVQQLQSVLEQESPTVALLVNNAGIGRIGMPEEIGAQEQMRMVELNCRVPLQMVHLFLPFMEPGSRIMNICSVAAFAPIPLMSVYAATKAFLYRWSRALRKELRPRRISVTAVCPYWIGDTGFIPEARKTDGKEWIRHFPMASSQVNVARRALQYTRMGLPVCSAGPVAKVCRLLLKLMPSELFMRIWTLIRKL